MYSYLFDPVDPWLYYIHSGRNGNYRKINGKGYVFRIKYYFWSNYGNYDNFFQR